MLNEVGSKAITPDSWHYLIRPETPDFSCQRAAFRSGSKFAQSGWPEKAMLLNAAIFSPDLYAT